MTDQRRIASTKEDEKQRTFEVDMMLENDVVPDSKASQEGPDDLNLVLNEFELPGGTPATPSCHCDLSWLFGWLRKENCENCEKLKIKSSSKREQSRTGL